MIQLSTLCMNYKLYWAPTAAAMEFTSFDTGIHSKMCHVAISHKDRTENTTQWHFLWVKCVGFASPVEVPLLIKAETGVVWLATTELTIDRTHMG